MMLTRTAVFEGRFKPGQEEAFFEAIEQRLAPLWRRFPHASDVRWFRIDAADDTARAIVMMQQIDYPSHDAMADALSSPIRDQARDVTLELMQMMDGTFYHYLSEGGKR